VKLVLFMVLLTRRFSWIPWLILHTGVTSDGHCDKAGRRGCGYEKIRDILD
jgi:hypothetical protein